MRRATLVLLAHAVSASGSSDFAEGVRNMSQVVAAEATYPPVEGITVFWKLAGEVSSNSVGVNPDDPPRRSDVDTLHRNRFLPVR